MHIPLYKGKAIQSKKVNSNNKIKILSISKDDLRTVWTFEKRQEFLAHFLDFLLKLGFSKKNWGIKMYFGVPKDNDESLDEAYIKYPFSRGYIDIKRLNELYLTFDNKDYDLELIIFSNSILLVMRGKKKNNKKSVNLILEFAEFKKQ